MYNTISHLSITLVIYKRSKIKQLSKGSHIDFFTALFIRFLTEIN